MAEPTTALTYTDLVKEVALTASTAYYGATGTDRALPPVNNVHDLDECKRAVTNGIRMFINDAPVRGWRWMRRIMSITFVPAITGTAEAGTSTSLTDTTIADTYADNYFNTFTIKIIGGTGEGETATVTGYTGSGGKFDFSGGLSGGSTPDDTSEYRICRSLSVIDADPARYLMDENFGGTVDGKILYAANSNLGHIEWRDESYIRERKEISRNTGYPTAAAIRPYEPTSNALLATRRFEFIVDPDPSTADTVEFPYTLYFNDFILEGGVADTPADATTTLIDATRTEPDDFFIGYVVRIIGGTGKGSYATVTGYAGSTGTFTVADWLDQSGNADGTDPVADSVYVVEATTNVHPAGFRFDDTILAACLARAEMDIENFPAGYMDYYMKKALPNAYNIDARSAPKRLGSMNYGPKIRERIWKDVESV